MSSLHIVSLNCNSYRRFLSEVQKFMPFEQWLQAHKIDIICLQEVKLHALDAQDERRLLGVDVVKYDFFWNICKGSPKIDDKFCVETSSSNSSPRNNINNLQFNYEETDNAFESDITTTTTTSVSNN